MIRTVNVDERVVAHLDIVSDFSYAWGVIHLYTPLLHSRIQQVFFTFYFVTYLPNLGFCSVVEPIVVLAATIDFFETCLDFVTSAGAHCAVW